MKITKKFILIGIILINFPFLSEANDFDKWLKDFKVLAISEGISEKTFQLTMEDAKFLPKVIEYDRYQPEFYEDTFTYISKRSNQKKVKKKRIGPMRTEDNRSLFYKKDISLLARNGFDFETSKKVMEMEKDDFIKIIKLL